jgi:membrane-associated phospholipid phosphatase
MPYFSFFVTRPAEVVQNRGHFPSDEAATKILLLALPNIETYQASIFDGGYSFPSTHHLHK